MESTEAPTIADAPDFNPPAEHPKSGVPLDGPEGFPLNHRLRAEAMSAAGVTEDPLGIITPELIAETGERLAKEKAETDQAEASDPLRSIRALTAHVAKLDDLGTLAELRTREAAGENRDPALAVIDRRVAALTAV